jgi:hypothetical protein
MDDGMFERFFQKGRCIEMGKEEFGMRHGLSLGEAISNLAQLDDEDTIYAAEPWMPDSAAIVAREPDSGGLPKEAVDAGCEYFLEVSIAVEFVEGLTASSTTPPRASLVCERVIEYAINDA